MASTELYDLAENPEGATSFVGRCPVCKAVWAANADHSCSCMRPISDSELLNMLGFIAKPPENVTPDSLTRLRLVKS